MSKRLALLLLLLCPFALPAAPAITVSGNSVTILGSAQTISLTCTLIDPNNTGNLRSGSNIITTFITSTATPSNVATCGPIYGNDVITDGYGNANTTYYKVAVFTVSGGIVASTPSLQQFYAFTGSGTIDLATATPLAPSFFTGPTGNVVMPGTLNVTGATTLGNLTVSGTGTFTGTVGLSNAGVFTNTQMNDYGDFLLNGLNTKTEEHDNVNGIYMTQPLLGGVLVPPSSTVPQANGITGLVQQNSPSTDAVGIYTQCRVATNNSATCWGGNTVTTDASGLTAGVSLFGLENDVAPQNAISAYTGAFGYTAAIGGTSTSWTSQTAISGSTAFLATRAGAATSRWWDIGFATKDNTIITSAFSIGAQGCNGSGASTCNSQNILFNSYNAGALTQGTILSLNTGTLKLTPATGAYNWLNGPIFLQETTAPSAASGADICYPDSTAHAVKCSYNNSAFSNVALNPPLVAGTTDLGTTALPFGNLWLGTAATNNFKFQPAATAAARIISIPDPLGNTTLPLTIASGAQALNTASVTTATCDTGVAATATGTLSTDRVDWSFNAAPTATNKYGAFLVVYAVPSANTVTFYTCNPSATTSTPTAMTVNWSVRRP